MPADVVRLNRWVWWSGIGAITAAVPTVVWRVLVGVGLTLGTPKSWRVSEALPGAGTGYVFTLSVIQLVAAMLTLVLIVPGADRVPRWSPVAPGRRLPTLLVVLASLTGSAVLAALCVVSAIHWSQVDPFRDAATVSGWSYLCWVCYAVAAAWPVLLVATTVGYRHGRHHTRDDR